MSCLPDSIAGRNYYAPTDQGFEKRLRQRMEEIRNLKVASPKANASHKPTKP
jgi:putative ATPase